VPAPSRNEARGQEAVALNVLLIGLGVIGTVYGAHLAAAGHTVSVLDHGSRTDDVRQFGLRARDVGTGALTSAVAKVVGNPGVGTYDLIIVAVRREQLLAVARSLEQVCAAPCILFLGNNPHGRAGLPTDLPGPTSLGFPGIGGTMVEGVAEYLPIAQQPTTIASDNYPALAEFADTMHSRGFAVSQTPAMEGWLAYHATFVACVAAALYRCGTDPRRLAAERPILDLMCRAITEGFAVQRAAGRTGLPKNLAILHHPLLRPVAVRYWATQLRAPLGELCFAAHARHAKPEMVALADDVLAVAGDRPHTEHLRRLLERRSGPTGV